MAPTVQSVKFSPFSVVDVPFWVLEDAHWAPQAAKLHGKHQASLNALPGSADKKTYEKLRLAWTREETWINQSLNALLAALPECVTVELFRPRFDGHDARLPKVERLHSAGIASVTGDPDFIVASDRTRIFGEAKVAAHPKNHKYSFRQFTKYMMLGALTQCARAPHLRRQASHLVLVPSADPAAFCGDYSWWNPSVEDGSLVVDPARIEPRDRTWGVADAGGWRALVRRTLLSPSVRSRFDVDVAELEALLARDSPVLVPTKVITWEAFLLEARRLCKAGGFLGLASAATALGRLACPNSYWPDE